MKFVDSLEDLEALYGDPAEVAVRKVANWLTPEYRLWIERSRFCILSTVGPEGTDASPCGDDGPVVAVLDDRTLGLPDWSGNQRIDSLRNIVRDPRASLMFMVPGSKNVIRANGSAKICAQPDLCAQFAKCGRQPTCVIVFECREIYAQCGRAILRADLWSGEDQSAGLPSVGEIFSAMTSGDVGGPDYDAGWADRAAKTLW